MLWHSSGVAAAPMSRSLWRLTLLLTLCLSLDFSSPFIAGAFRFEVDESTEGALSRARVVRAGRLAVAAPRSPAQDLSRPRGQFPRGRLEVRAHEEWLVNLRESHTPASHPPSSTEEH
jgi:hypothetical protein